MSVRSIKTWAVVRPHRGYDLTKPQQRDGPIPVVSSSGVSSYHSEFEFHSALALTAGAAGRQERSEKVRQPSADVITYHGDRPAAPPWRSRRFESEMLRCDAALAILGDKFFPFWWIECTCSGQSGDNRETPSSIASGRRCYDDDRRHRARAKSQYPCFGHPASGRGSRAYSIYGIRGILHLKFSWTRAQRARIHYGSSPALARTRHLLRSTGCRRNLTGAPRGC